MLGPVSLGTYKLRHFRTCYYMLTQVRLNKVRFGQAKPVRTGMARLDQVRTG